MSTVDPLVEDYLRRLDHAAAALPPDRRTDLLDEIGEHIAVARASGAGDDEVAVRNVLDRLGAPEEIVAAAHEDVPTGWGTPAASAPGGWDGAPLAPQPRGTGLELAAVLLLTVGSFVPVIGWLVGGVLLWTSSLWRRREKLLGTLVVPFGPGLALFTGPLLLGPFGRSESCSTTGGFGSSQSLVPAAPPPAPAAPQAVPAEPVGPPPAAELPRGAPVEPPPDLQLPAGGNVTVCEISGLSSWAALALVLVLVVAPVVVAVVLYRIARRRAAQAPPTAAPASGAAAASPWGPLEVSAVLLIGLGGFLVPFLGAAVGLVLACVSGRWTVRDKVVAGVLALTPAALGVTSLVAPIRGSALPGGWEVLLLLLVTGPVAAGYLAVVLSRRTASTPPRAADRR